MKFRETFFCVIILLFAASCSNNREVKQTGFSIKDDLNNTISLASIPKRVISLAPNLTEMIYDLGQGGSLVGDTKYCDYPEEAKHVAKIGDMLTFNYEKIVSLKPDLVFITVAGNTKETYDKFRELGIKIFVSNPTNYAGIKKTYLDLGKIFGVENEAKLKTAKWDSVVTSISVESKKYEQRSAMFLVDLKPAMLAGKNTFLNEYLTMCGLKNIAESSPMNYPLFSREDILRVDPDYIIYMAGKDETVSTVKAAYPEWLQLKAVRKNNIILVDRDLYPRPGPRFVAALKDLFTRLHPRKK